MNNTEHTIEQFGLNISQTEILYNLEYHKTRYNISSQNLFGPGSNIMINKKSWLKDWQKYIEEGFPSFVGNRSAQLHWYEERDLIERIAHEDPRTGQWFRLALLESALFVPYFPLSTETKGNNKEIPSEKHKIAATDYARGQQEKHCDEYLDNTFSSRFGLGTYVKRLRASYKKIMSDQKDVLKNVLITTVIAAATTVATVFTAGVFAPMLAAALVGSQFAGLSGIALTNACLAYLGGGAIAAGGLGIAGGTAVITGGGALLGAGIGTGIGGAVSAQRLTSKAETIRQTSKLLVAVREIFLEDMHDVSTADDIYETYVENVTELQYAEVELENRLETASPKEKKELKAAVKNAKDSLEALKKAKKSMRNLISSYK